MKGTVENKGSTARDHLANERTFLAWVRTALGLVGFGVVIGRLGVGEGLAHPGELNKTAFALVGAGAGLLVYGLVRYLSVTRALEEGRFPIARRGPWAVGTGTLALVALAVYLLLR